ncbi:hypothetical protein ACLB2K_009714 [Fragaria x ananassa]
MGKKKTDEAGASKKGKSAGKDASKDREKVQAPTASSSLFDTEASSSSSSSAKAKVASYINDIDLPPSDDDEVEEEHQPNQQRRSEAKMLDISMTGKELKKREKKDLLAAHVAELSKREALRDDHDAFTVVIGSRDCEDADANIKDISIEGFSVAWSDYSVEFHFPEPSELTPPLLQLIDVSFSYPNREDFRLSDVDAGIDMGTRVAIVGPNGAGKSTLLNLLAGDLVPSEGEVRRSQKLRIGRYSQHFVDLLTMEETPVSYLLRLHPDQVGCSKQEAVRAKLGKFGLPGHNHLTPIAKLSGGQNARVVFTSISMSKPHILLLDEPTNHLDMQSIDALADALDEFTGGVVLVSHDSRLISRVCEDEERSQIWIVEDGTVMKFDGSFNEYKKELLEQIKAEVDE